MALGQKLNFSPSVYIPKPAVKGIVSWKHISSKMEYKCHYTCSFLKLIKISSLTYHISDVYILWLSLFKVSYFLVLLKAKRSLQRLVVLVFLGKWWSISVYTVSGWCMAVHIAAPQAQHCSQLLRQLLPRGFKTYSPGVQFRLKNNQML